MGRITLILGGARSGKSTFARVLAGRYKKVAFIATAEARDAEMSRRISAHKKERPAGWKTLEEPRGIPRVLAQAGAVNDCVIVDCLTLLVSNLLLDRKSEAEICGVVSAALDAAKKCKSRTILVSNEVGLGLVPTGRLGRAFRDAAGRVNQLAAASADEVYFLASGIPLRIKPGNVCAMPGGGKNG